MSRAALRVSTRIVVLTNHWVYKFPIDRRGYLQGRNEGKVWKQYKDCKTLAPLKWEFLGVVCMARAQEIERRPLQWIRYIKDLIPALDIDNCDLYNVENWGYYNGRYVLLDYGIDERISKMY